MKNGYKKIFFVSKLMMVTLACLIFSFQNAAAQQHKTDKVNVGLIYPLSSNGKNAVNDTNKFSLNLIAGVSAAERGIAIAGFSNIIRKDASKVMIAGFSNHIGQKADGLQLAGFMNTSGKGKGAAVAGFMNKADDMNGVQFVGFFNMARNVQGMQTAGFINIARNVKGSQLGGFMNVAKKVTGVQIAGFMNVADSSDFPIGLVNIIKNGEKSIGVTIDENATLMLSFRSGGKIMYGIIGLGYNTKNNKEVYAYEAGFGAHLIRTAIFRLNAELVSGGLENFHYGDYFKTTLRLMPAVKLGKSIEIFGGPALSYINTDSTEGIALTKKYLHEFRNKPADLQVLKLGYTAGLQVHF